MKRTAFKRKRFKALTKSTLCQTLKKPARQGRKLAGKGAYMDVSNRSLQVNLTRQAKTPLNSLSFEGVFAFAGFVSGLSRLPVQAAFVCPRPSLTSIPANAIL